MVQAPTVYPEDRCALGDGRLRHVVVTGAQGTIDEVMPLATSGTPVLAAVELLPIAGSMSSPMGKECRMRKWIALSGLALIVVLVAIQFIPVTTVNPPVENDIPTSPEVKTVLRRACYDCHSHETVWPWYSQIAPISWIIARDVQEGRAEVNFSTWNRYSTQQQVKKLKESWEEVAEGEMPPWFYLAIIVPEVATDRWPSV
jgi:hypothetical protein